MASSPCANCAASFNNNKALSNHSRFAHREYKYKCSCGNRFKTKADLELHTEYDCMKKKPKESSSA